MVKKKSYDFLKKCASFSLAVRVGLMIASGFLVSLIFKYFVYDGAMQKIQKHRVVLESRMMAVAGDKKSMRYYERQKKIYNLIERTAGEKKVNMFSLIKEIAQKNNVVLMSMKPKKNGIQHGFYVDSFKVVAVGTYKGLMNLLEGLSKRSLLLSFDEMGLVGDDKKLELSLNMYLYRKAI